MLYKMRCNAFTVWNQDVLLTSSPGHTASGNQQCALCALCGQPVPVPGEGIAFSLVMEYFEEV